MKKKAAITMLALGMLIFLGAQPQMPHLEALDGPYNAQNMIDMTLCRYDPTDPPIIYGVNADSCLTKTTNRGDSWTILPQGHIYKSGVRCVAVHPANPDIVYKGEWGYISQKGIMKSTDGGYFWTLINNGLPDYVTPSKLGIFPHSGYYNYLLLGMSIDQQPHGGYPLYRSTNGGSQWWPVIQWGSDFLNITDFSFDPDPNEPYRVCLSAKQSSDPGNSYRGVWMSTDFGETWSHIGRPDNMPYPEVTCVAMVDENIIYAGFWTGITEQAIGGVEITTDGGVTWSVLSPTLTTPAKDIVFDTSNPGTFYVAFGAGEGDEGNGIIKFENYGASWSYYNNGLTDKFVNVLTIDNTDLYAGTDKGFYYTESADANYVWTEKVNGLLKGWVDYVYPYPDKIISFANNKGQLLSISYLVNSIDNGVSWNTINTFNSGTCAAALQGATLGINSIAVSLSSRDYNDFSGAVSYARDLIARIIASKTKGVILNVNIPDGVIKGERITKMGKRIYHDKVIRNSAQKNVMYSVIDGTLSCKIAADTDFKAIKEHYVSITPLKLDLTDYEGMEILQEYLKR